MSILQACTTCNLHKKGGPAGGVLTSSLMLRLISFSRKRSTVWGFVLAYLSLVELPGIYHW